VGAVGGICGSFGVEGFFVGVVALLISFLSLLLPGLYMIVIT